MLLMTTWPDFVKSVIRRRSPLSGVWPGFPGVGKNQWLQIEEFGKQYTVLKREPVKLGGSKGNR